MSKLRAAALMSCPLPDRLAHVIAQLRKVRFGLASSSGEIGDAPVTRNDPCRRELLHSVQRLQPVTRAAYRKDSQQTVHVHDVAREQHPRTGSQTIVSPGV